MKTVNVRLSRSTLIDWQRWRFILLYAVQPKLEEASTHESAKMHDGVFWCLVYLTLWSQNKWVSRIHGGKFLCRVWWSWQQWFLGYSADRWRPARVSQWSKHSDAMCIAYQTHTLNRIWCFHWTRKLEKIFSFRGGGALLFLNDSEQHILGYGYSYYMMYIYMVSNCHFSLYLNIAGVWQVPGKCCWGPGKSSKFLQPREWEPCLMHCVKAMWPVEINCFDCYGVSCSRV